MFKVAMNVALCGDNVAVVEADKVVLEPVLAADEVLPALNKLRLTVLWGVELNLSASGMAVGDWCTATKKRFEDNQKGVWILTIIANSLWKDDENKGVISSIK